MTMIGNERLLEIGRMLSTLSQNGMSYHPDYYLGTAIVPIALANGLLERLDLLRQFFAAQGQKEIDGAEDNLIVNRLSRVFGPPKTMKRNRPCLGVRVAG